MRRIFVYCSILWCLSIVVYGQTYIAQPLMKIQIQDGKVTKILPDQAAPSNENDELKSNASPMGWQTIMSEDFETGVLPTGWTKYAASGKTDAYWGIMYDLMAHNGRRSAWCAGAGTDAGTGGVYKPNMQAWMKYGPFSLEGVTDARLTFWYWNNSENNYDKFFFGACTTQSGTYYGTEISGDYSTWQQGTLDLKNVYTLGDLTGKSQVWIAFVFSSDGATQFEGAYVDDVVLEKYSFTNAPDLLWTNMTLSKKAWYVGNVVTADLTEKNQGDVTAGAHYTQLYLSTNTTISTSDVALGSSIYFTSILPGTEQTQSISFTVPNVSNGIYYVGAIVDINDNVAESDESNNNYYRIGRVTIGDILQAPTLSSPNDFASNLSPPVLLQWYESASTIKTGYRLQVAASSSFSEAALLIDDDQIPSTTLYYYLNKLAYNNNYYWRVSTLGPDFTEGNFSSYRRFTTRAQKTVSPSEPIAFPSEPRNTSDFRLISFPGEDPGTVSDWLTGKDGTDWVMYQDDGYSINRMGGNISLNMGQGYWLLRKNAFNPSKTMTMPQYNFDGTVSISVIYGWNIIGNPFDESVDWDFVKQINGLGASDDIHSYIGGGYTTETKLEPFKGYYFYNLSSSQYSLKIPAPVSNAIARNKTNKEPIMKWRLQIVLETEGEHDRENYIGICSASGNERDTLESFKPPQVLEHSAIYFDRPAWCSRYTRFNKDYRPDIGAGQIWTFTLSCAEQKSSTIRINGIEKVPAEYDVLLVRPNNLVPVNLRVQAEIPYIATAGKHEFKLVVGSQNFVKQNIVAHTPQTFALFQNYPNPFNPTTIIQYGLPERSRVRIEIYDILGKHIATLINSEQPAGHNEVVWKANVPSGIYLCRMEAVSLENPSKHTVQTRKMTVMR